MRVLLILSMPAVATMTMAISCGHSIPARTESPIPAFPGADATPPPDPLFTFVPVITPVPLTGEQQSSVEEIIRADPRIHETAGGLPYSVTQIETWHDSVGVFAGAVATVILSRTIDQTEVELTTEQSREFYSDWPADVREKYRPYRLSKFTYSVTNLKRLHVKVDLDRQEVVELNVWEEFGQQTALVAPPFPTPVFSEDGSAEASDIFLADENVQAILAGRDYEIGQAYTFDFKGVPFAGVFAGFNETQDRIEGDWKLLVDYSEDLDYQTEVIHFTAKRIIGLRAVLNLDTHEVAWLDPVTESEGD